MSKKSKSAKKPHRPAPPAPARKPAPDDAQMSPQRSKMQRINAYASLAIVLAIVASFFVTMLIPLFSSP